MRIINYLESLHDFFFQNRQSGTTSLIKKIASENDIYVLVFSEKEKKQFKGKALCLNDVTATKGLLEKPILVDNYLMMQILENAHADLIGLMEVVEIQDDLINDISKKIKAYKMTK